MRKYLPNKVVENARKCWKIYPPKLNSQHTSGDYFSLDSINTGTRYSEMSLKLGQRPSHLPSDTKKSSGCLFSSWQHLNGCASFVMVPIHTMKTPRYIIYTSNSRDMKPFDITTATQREQAERRENGFGDTMSTGYKDYGSK